MLALLHQRHGEDRGDEERTDAQNMAARSRTKLRILAMVRVIKGCNAGSP